MPGLPDLPSTGAWAHEQTDPICIPPNMVSSCRRHSMHTIPQVKQDKAVSLPAVTL